MRPASLNLRHLLTVAGLLATVKLAGAAKSLMCGRAFGATRELDCYFVAFSLVSLICDTVSGSLTPALIPALAGATNRRSCYGGLLYRWCGGLAAGAVVLGSCDLFLYRLMARNFSAPDLALTHKLLLIMAPMLPLTAAIAIFRALLNTEGKFGFAAGTPILTPLAIFVLIVLGARSHGVAFVALGTTLGSVGEFVILACALRCSGYAALPRTGLTLPAKWLAHSYAPTLASNFVGGTRLAVDAAVAASLGPGSAVALNLGTRLVAVASSIGPGSFSTVLLPSFLAAAAAHDWKSLREQAFRASVGGAGLGVLIALAVWALSAPLAHLAFHGSASGHLNIAMLAHIQTVSFTQLPFVFVLAVLTRAALACRHNRLLFAVAIVTAAANLVSDVICARTMGTAGIAFATTIVNVAGCLLLLPAIFANPRFTSSLQNRCKRFGSSLYAGSRVSQ